MASLNKGARITGMDRAQLARRLKSQYEKGASIRSLAASNGRSCNFVRKVLTECGVTIRKSGEQIRLYSGKTPANPGQTPENTENRPQTRYEAHQLVESLPEKQIPATIELLRQLAGTKGEQRKRRTFRTRAAFNGPSDLGHQTKEILKRDLGSENSDYDHR